MLSAYDNFDPLRKCEQVFGEAQFLQLYKYLQTVQQQQDPPIPPEEIDRVKEEIVGSDKLSELHYIYELLDCEEKFYGV